MSESQPPTVMEQPAPVVEGPKPVRLARSFPISNQKGGVAKSVTTINLAEAWARQMKRVLVVDVDGQGNTAAGLGIKEGAVDKNNQITDVIMGRPVDLEKMVLSSNRKDLKIDVVAPTGDLQVIDLEILQTGIVYGVKKGREVGSQAVDLADFVADTAASLYLNLRRGLIDPLRPNYDYILIDCPPGYSMVTGSALLAGDCVLVPLDSSGWAWDGARRAVSYFDKMSTLTGHRIRTLGFLLTRFKPQLTAHRTIHEQLGKDYPNEAFKTTIRECIYFMESAYEGTSLWEAKGRRRTIVADYEMLADEIAQRFEAAEALMKTPSESPNP